MRNNFILYEDNASINYKHLLRLYSIAEYNRKNRMYDSINFNTIDELTKRINGVFQESTISKTTLNNFLNDKGTSKRHEYKYFSYDKDAKKITLNVDFRSGKESFVILSDKECSFLIAQDDELLIRYFIYIKHYCGSSPSGKTDFTAKQFLEACGLSSSSGNNLTRISNYNSILSASGLIRIEKTRDNNGHCRNIYSIPLQ